VSLSAEETVWLAKHPVIRFAIDPDNAPIEWINRKDQKRGMSFDLLDILAQRLGVHFEWVDSINWYESIQMLRNKKVDMLPAFRRIDIWQEDFLFTRPWYTLPGVILSEQKYRSLEELEGKNVAVVHGYLWDDLVSGENGNFNVIRADDSHSCVSLVADGEVDAMVGDLASVTWIVNRSGAANLRTVPIKGENLQLTIAVRSDWQMLQKILDKTIDTISESEFDSMEADWIQLIEPPIWKNPVFQVVAFFIVLIILGIITIIIFWNRSLQREISRQTSALEDAAMKLIHAEKMESIGQLAAGIAHEVKNPLAIIQMGIDHLSHDNECSASTHVALQDMDEAVRKADGTIRKLLNYSRGTPPDMKSDDVAIALNKVLDLLSHECRQRNIKLETTFAEKLPLISMDVDQIQQLFMNIVLNAIQSMTGEGVLSVNCSTRRLRQADLQRDSTGSFREGDTVVWIEINDTGHGIKEQDLGKLYDPFFTTRPLGEGTGLGLTVSLNIVRAHNASINIQNREAGGASVVVMLPTEKER
jgi:signal transduction histidine kinase